MDSSLEPIGLIEAWRAPHAQRFFRNVWPLYLHEISGYDSDFYALNEEGRWLPDIVEDWIAPVTPNRNLRARRADDDPGQPFARAYAITRSDRPVGFACVGITPFAYMPEDADRILAELFLTHPARGTGTAARAVELLIQRHPGRWYLRAIHDNTRAIRFWRKTLPAAGVRELEERSDDGDVTWRFVAGA